MKVVPFVVTYNGMAAGPCIDRCVKYLMTNRPRNLGTAIKRVDLYPHCRTRDPMLPGLKTTRDRFQARLKELPFIRFRRKTGLFNIAYVSKWVHSDEMFGASTIELSKAEFACLCREFAKALSLIRHGIKKTDDFNIAKLEVHLQERLQALP